MRTCGNHLAIVVLLSTILGWTPASAGRIEARGWLAGSAGLPAAQAVGTNARQPPQPPTRPVQAPPLQVPADTPSPGNPVVVLATSLGDITLELFKDRAPASVDNFLRYVTDGFYEGTVFHRVKKGFMIQGGGFTADLTEKPTRPPIQNEATNGLRNLRGTLAMARRAALRSATSQFYVNVADNRMLDHAGYSPDEFGYAVFGRVLSGMDVVDRIAAVQTRTAGDMEDVPVDPVIIKSARVVK
jgi:cyclophilin family peptidyl-prolyl cis-trans isomerase